MVQFGITLIIVGVLIAGIWILLEIKRMKHRVFGIFLIGLILFTYLSFMIVLNGHPEINLGTASGLFQAAKLYFAWLVNAFDNLRSLTAQVIKLNWTSTAGYAG